MRYLARYRTLATQPLRKLGHEKGVARLIAFDCNNLDLLGFGSSSLPVSRPPAHEEALLVYFDVTVAAMSFGSVC